MDQSIINAYERGFIEKMAGFGFSPSVIARALRNVVLKGYPLAKGLTRGAIYGGLSIPVFSGFAGLSEGLFGKDLTPYTPQPLPDNAGSAARVGRFIHDVWSTPYQWGRNFGIEALGRRPISAAAPVKTENSVNTVPGQTVVAKKEEDEK